MVVVAGETLKQPLESRQHEGVENRAETGGEQLPTCFSSPLFTGVTVLPTGMLQYVITRLYTSTSFSLSVLSLCHTLCLSLFLSLSLSLSLSMCLSVSVSVSLSVSVYVPVSVSVSLFLSLSMSLSHSLTL